MTWGQNFYTISQRMNEQLCQIWRRCAPPFFCYLRKTDGGGHICAPPPPAVRGLITRDSIKRPVFYSSEILLMLKQHRVTNGSIVSSLIDLMQKFWVDIDEKKRSFQDI